MYPVLVGFASWFLQLCTSVGILSQYICILVEKRGMSYISSYLAHDISKVKIKLVTFLQEQNKQLNNYPEWL